MSLWTRLSEALVLIGQSISQFLGALAERKPTAPEKTLAFTVGMIALSAKMAKADGQVTGAEVKAFQKFFHVPTHELASVARVFTLAQQDVAGYETYARQIAKLFKPGAALLEDVLDGLFYIALADHQLHAAEERYLARVADIFGFDASAFERIRQRHIPVDRCDPYFILGMPPTATLGEIKTRYRKLVQENHPDRHIAAGMPVEMIELATHKLAQITTAYAQIEKERGRP